MEHEPFVVRTNVDRFRARLEREPDRATRETLEQLIAEYEGQSPRRWERRPVDLATAAGRAARRTKLGSLLSADGYAPGLSHEGSRDSSCLPIPNEYGRPETS